MRRDHVIIFFYDHMIGNAARQYFLAQEIE